MRALVLCLVLLCGCDDEALRYADGTEWENVSLSPGRILPRDMDSRQYAQWAAGQQAIPHRDIKTFAPVWGGFSSNPSGDVSYVDTGGLVFMWFGNTGTSNATTFTFTGIPIAIRPLADFRIIVSAFNGGVPVAAEANVLTSGGVAFSAPDPSASPDFEFDVAAWANTGAKGWTGLIMYPK